MDAKNDEKSSRSGGMDETQLALLELASAIRESADALKRQSALLQRQNRILMSLIEQNASMVEMFVQDNEEENDEVERYLDGTPVRKS